MIKNSITIIRNNSTENQEKIKSILIKLAKESV